MGSRGVYIGIDVGGTNLRAGAVDEEGSLLAVKQIPLRYEGRESFTELLARLAKETAEAADCSSVDIKFVGIGLPGAVRDGKVLYTANIPMENVPLEVLLRKHLDVPVRLENDANCAALGEWLLGSGRGCRNFGIITLGTGVGGGFVVNGQLLTGGTAGEVGHMVIERNGAACECGRRGCWEAYASATGLVRMAREAMTRHPDSLLHEMSMGAGLEGRTIFRAAETGDEVAREVCRMFVEYLALGVTNLFNLLQPEVLALSGGIADAPEDLLLNPLRRIVEETCYSRHIGVLPRIQRAELGNDAGIIGAALLSRAI